MNERDAAHFSCVCGKRLAWEAAENTCEGRELTLPCGRKYELEFREAGWAPGPEPLAFDSR